MKYQSLQRAKVLKKEMKSLSQFQQMFNTFRDNNIGIIVTYLTGF